MSIKSGLYIIVFLYFKGTCVGSIVAKIISFDYYISSSYETQDFYAFKIDADEKFLFLFSSSM